MFLQAENVCGKQVPSQTMGVFMYYVYAHLNEDNEVIYIGKGSGDRAWKLFNRNKNWRKALPHGPEEIKLLAWDIEDEKEAYALESSYIKKYKELGHPLVNKDPAKPWLGKKRDPEFMRRFIQAGQAPEAREKRRQAMLGRELPKEQKEKISAALTGRSLTEEHKAKIGLANKGHAYRVGHKHTEETKRIMSEAAKGRKHTESTKQKLREKKTGTFTTKSKQVLCVELGLIFWNARDAADTLKCNAKHIQACCVGRRSRHQGYTWKYV